MGKLIEVQNLEKEFRLGLMRKRVHAVKGISFEVESGEIFGFLGPNGAGKTTTIKMLTGLIRPTRGGAKLFGLQLPNPKALTKVGFLPENPYIFPYLSPLEFVELCGRLSGLSGKILRERSRQALERTGVLYAADRPARRLSKGMLQRTGLAAALVADPELLILDEPMSGLDPVGRKEVKDLILEEKRAGKTIFFSTHILADVEALCDRVTIMRKGEVVVAGRLDELLKRDSREVFAVFSGSVEQLQSFALAEQLRCSETGQSLTVYLPSRQKLPELLRLALNSGAELEELGARQETLEHLFVREAIFGDDSGLILGSSAPRDGGA